jgi:hypothetical protein
MSRMEDISVRDLEMGEMISITGRWVGELKPKFLAIPEIKELFPHVEERHNALVAARKTAALDALLQSLSDLGDRLDYRHDHLIRALYFLLRAYGHFMRAADPPKDAEADETGRAEGVLFPDGLGIVIKSHDAESGNAAQLLKAALEQFKTLLETIHMTGEISALDIAAMIGDVGQKLGGTEQEKSVAKVDAANMTITASEARRRMRQWADTIETVLSNLALSKAPQTELDLLRQAVLDTVDKAVARRRAKRAKTAKEAEAAKLAPGASEPKKER